MIEHFSLGLLVVLIITGFIAGYIDAIAGGGGMIQALALLMVGIAPLNTLATNKIVSLSGTVTAVIRYAQGRAINWYLATACIIPCMLAAAWGSDFVIDLSTTTITWMIILCIPVAFAVMLIRHNKQLLHKESNNRLKAIAILSPIAFYDGLIGPGTGTYMAITANKWLGMSFLRATGLAKPLNLSTNIASAVVYIFAGKVIWLIAIPMAVASVCGAYLGSHSAIKRGDSFIKKLMLIMLLVMLIVNLLKLLW